MDHVGALRPVEPGEAAPDFTVPGITKEAEVGLGDYRGRTTLMLGLFRGVYCPFCRRNISMLDTLSEALLEVGTETLAIVTSPVERARLYFRYRPPKMVLASDTGMSVHGAYGLPSFQETDEPMQWPRTVNFKELENIRINPAGEFAEPVLLSEAGKLMDRLDNFTYQTGDSEEAMATWNQLGGLFLIDPDGIVRWSHVEGTNGPASLGTFPNKQEILGAATGMAA